MGVLLQGFFKLPPDNALPSPADGKPGVPWWWDHLAAQARDFSLAGFTAVWLPPILKGSNGASPGADGYGPFDDYDIGSKKQKGSIPTRFGTREQVQRCAAILRANGLDIYLDMVEHHRAGDGADHTPDAFKFRYLGANGTPNTGRFPKDPDNFLPQVPRDPDLGGAPSDDFPFARELAPINAKPHHYIFDGLIAASDWLTRTIGAQGYRLDDVKGLSTDFLLPFLNSKAMAGKFAVGEFFSGVTALVNQWIFNPRGMQGRSNAFDFPLKFMLNGMCNNPGRFNMADLDHAGVVGISPLSAVTFVENHDTDLKSDQNIVTNKLMGYAYILTSEGYPMVFYKDYSTDPDCYGLQPKIDNLIWIHEMLASGTTEQRWKDFDVFAYERTGGSRLLVALNNDPNGPHTIHVATGFGANAHLKDYTGHGADVFTDGGGGATIQVPANINGLGYVCYSRVGQDRPLPTTSHPTTQDFEGAADLDILSAMNGKTIIVGRIFCAANKAVKVAPTVDRTGWTAASQVELALKFPDGTEKTLTITSVSPADQILEVTTTTEGFYTLQLTANGMPAANLNPPYKLSATYAAPNTFDAVNQPVNDAVAAGELASAADPAEVGQWTEEIKLPNVPIHTHVLPTGKVLFWGRRTPPAAPDYASLNQQSTQAFLWDPANPEGGAKPTANEPTDVNGKSINLFCAGHTLLADGTLMVTGGHLFDSQGIDATTIYDPSTNRWSAKAPMNNGRWYPSAITLADGTIFVCGGAFAQGAPTPPPKNQSQPNNIPQIFENAKWNDVRNFIGLPLFPRLHLAPNGAIFMSGALSQSYFLEGFDASSANLGNWVQVSSRSINNADYATSVMFDVGKVVFMGGGGGSDDGVAPANVVETIDLNAANPAWSTATPMKFHRRQHNATILADGTVLVTGGCQVAGFDSLGKDQTIRIPELWDPHTGSWTEMATEAVDRCYHSTAVLLPDGKVFSGGGGEYDPDNNGVAPNPPANTHFSFQIFSPPYLFRGARPTIANPPTSVVYGQTFDIETPQAAEINKVTWIRLSSVTHSFNSNQRINFLPFKAGAGKLTITAPANGNVCPPGHYMLFVLNQKGVPSEAAIVQITAGAAAPVVAHVVERAAVNPLAVLKQQTPLELDADIQAKEKNPPVVVGVTAGCPYGISACWGGAYESLNHLHGVRLVRPVPNQDDSTAYVYLKHSGLPDLDVWPAEFARMANGTHVFRGVEVTVTGVVSASPSGSLSMEGNDSRPPVLLSPIEAADKIQWDTTKRAPQPLEPLEQSAFSRLLAEVEAARGSVEATITGPLKKNDNDFYLEVRKFIIGSKTISATRTDASTGSATVRNAR
jgi:Domain of unknown function (DUF1929)